MDMCVAQHIYIYNRISKTEKKTTQHLRMRFKMTTEKKQEQHTREAGSCMLTPFQNFFFLIRMTPEYFFSVNCFFVVSGKKGDGIHGIHVVVHLIIVSV